MRGNAISEFSLTPLVKELLLKSPFAPDFSINYISLNTKSWRLGAKIHYIFSNFLQKYYVSEADWD